MESLFPELAARVARYLTPRDLAACTGVSVHWRDVFGSDQIWKRLCDLEVEEHLRTTPSIVEPVFSVYSEEDSALTPLSRWRLAFLREQHLWSNWRKGNFKTFEEKMKGRVKFITNDFLVNLGSNSIDLWDVRPVPAVKVGSLKIDTSFYFNFTVFENGYMVLKSSNYKNIRICKVDVTKNTILLKYHFVFNETTGTLELVCANTPGSSRTAFSSGLEVTIVKGKFCIGHFLFRAHRNSFHVWDLESGIKLKQESLSTNLLESGLAVVGSKTCDDVLVLVPYSMGSQPSEQSILNLQCRVYDVQNLSFSHFTLTCSVLSEFMSVPSFIPRQCAITNNYVAFTNFTYDVKTVRIFNYRTDQLIYMLEGNFDIDVSINSRVQVIVDAFIFLDEKSSEGRALLVDGQVQGRLCSVFCSSGDFVKDVTDFDVESFEVIGDRLVQVIPSYEVWGINRFGFFKTDVELFGLKEVNKGCTKLVEEYIGSDKIQILYFW